MKWNWRPLSLKSWHFEASEDIMTKFKSQALHIIRIKYWKSSGSGNPPSLIPALWKIAILGLKTKISILFCTRLYVYAKTNQFLFTKGFLLILFYKKVGAKVYRNVYLIIKYVPKKSYPNKSSVIIPYVLIYKVKLISLSHIVFILHRISH